MVWEDWKAQDARQNDYWDMIDGTVYDNKEGQAEAVVSGEEINVSFYCYGIEKMVNLKKKAGRNDANN